jgi:DNA-binding NtrC family response regulator
VLLREGMASVLDAAGFDVVLQAADADTLIAGIDAARPHVVVLDVRMPPTHTTEGLVAAEQIRAEHPEIGVIVLSQSVEPSAAMRLLEGATEEEVFPEEEAAPLAEEKPSRERKPAPKPKPFPVPGAMMQPPPDPAKS